LLTITALTITSVDMAAVAMGAAGMPVAEIGTAVAGMAAVAAEAAGMPVAEIGTAVAGMAAAVTGTAMAGTERVMAGIMVVMVAAGELVRQSVSVLGLAYSGERSQRLPIIAAMTIAMTTPLMPGHPNPRFGIGAIRIRAITPRYHNARFPGDKLFSKL
jgi:hypothetical protein